MSDGILVSSNSLLTYLISKAAQALNTSGQTTITAINFAIPQAIKLVQVLKHKIKDLHQTNQFSQTTDTHKTHIKITLSLTPLNSSHTGYQCPIPLSEVEQNTLIDLIKISSYSQRRVQKSLKARKQQTQPKQIQQKPNRRLLSEFKNKKGRNRSRQTQLFTTRKKEAGRNIGAKRGLKDKIPFEQNKSSYEQKRKPEILKYILLPKHSEKEPKDILVGYKSFPMAYAKEGLLKLKQEKLTNLVIKGSGQMIPKAIRVAEEIKRYEIGLHQLNNFVSRMVEDHYRPVEEGLDEVVKQRKMIGIQITLSKEVLDNTLPGYQFPIAIEEVKNLTFEEVKSLQ